MKTTQEKLEETEDRPVEVDMGELQKAARESIQARDKQEKTPSLEMDDINSVVVIKRIFKHKSTFQGKEFYYSALLEKKPGGERWKTLNGWDLEAIATGASEFKVGTEKWKGAYKLVLKPMEGGNPPSPRDRDCGFI
jgi:hypothetical protein